jgi:hypothetical protein
MKKVFVLLVMSLFVLQGMSQTATTTTKPEQVVVNVTDLTPGQLEKIKEAEQLKTMTEKISTYGKWVGVGNEVGVAIKEGLTAVVDVADKFGNTDVGKFTMYLIAWKVAGKDIVGIGLGMIILFAVTLMLFKSFRRLYPRKVIIKGNRLMFWKEIQYQIINPREFDGLELVKILHIFFLIGAYGILFAIMFS